jgi:hypothetical protein
MKYYRCYLYSADGHIATAKVLKCADDCDAERQCRDVFAATDRYSSAEIWDGARKVYRHPDHPAALSAESRRRRKGDAGDQDRAIADALSAQIATDRRQKSEADAVKAARLREQRLKSEAQSRLKGRGATRSR